MIIKLQCTSVSNSTSSTLRAFHASHQLRPTVKKDAHSVSKRVAGYTTVSLAEQSIISTIDLLWERRDGEFADWLECNK